MGSASQRPVLIDPNLQQLIAQAKALPISVSKFFEIAPSHPLQGFQVLKKPLQLHATQSYPVNWRLLSRPLCHQSDHCQS